MENIVPISYLEHLKRYWRRRRYQRLALSGANKKRKLQVTRLGDKGKIFRHWKLRVVPKLRLKFVSPLKILARFHDSYVDLMVRLASNVAKFTNNGVLAGKSKVAKEKQISFVYNGGEEIDSKFVLELYKRIAASRSVAAY